MASCLGASIFQVRRVVTLLGDSAMNAIPRVRAIASKNRCSCDVPRSGRSLISVVHAPTSARMPRTVATWASDKRASAYDDGTYQKTTNETASYWSDLIALSALLATDDLARIENKLPAMFDVDAYPRWLAANTSLSHIVLRRSARDRS